MLKAKIFLRSWKSLPKLLKIHLICKKLKKRNIFLKGEIYHHADFESKKLWA